MDDCARPSPERRQRNVSRRDDPAHRSLELRKILCVSGPRDGRIDNDVPYRWHPSGPTSACRAPDRDRKSTRLNSSHMSISYAVFCLKKKKKKKKYTKKK